MKKSASFHKYLNEKLKDEKFRKIFEKESALAEIAFQLARLRTKKGYSQRDLAKKLKTTQSVISRIENADQNISILNLEKIAKLFGKFLQVRLI